MKLTAEELALLKSHAEAVEDGPILQLLAHIEALEAERQWLPIEQAPKDGETPILAWDDGWHILTGYPDGVFDDDYSTGAEYRPTHYMPLPQPPKVGE